MSNQFATEQLLELLLQLKKTTPAAARQILNERPPIAYALITLMVSMNAINFEVFQKTLSDYGAAQAAQATAPVQSSTPTPAPLSAVPPHLQPTPQPHSRTATPPAQNPYQNHQPQAGYGYPPMASQPPPGYGRSAPPTAYPAQSGYGPPAPRAPAVLPDVLASIPDEQKQMIMGVLAMTPEQINLLPPADRANIIQLRATLGIPPP
ncbi:hypothetical protein B0H10DRAFT_2227357 [Mycena sp. CBHHK59/15]|nr:hypothetical protein B0H10DRAFT_2227357 [Mycena sp. CBHHK59/15]